MATKKTPDVNKTRLLALKKIGVLKDVSARGTLSKSEKEKVRKNWKEYHDIAVAPKSNYKVKDVSHYEPRDIKALKRSGYKVINGKLYVDLQGYDSMKVRRDGDFVLIDRAKGNRKTETEFVGTSRLKANWRDKLLEQYSIGGFKKGNFLGLKLFDHGAFHRAMYQSIDAIFNYAEHDFEPNDPKTDKEYLLNNLNLIVVSVRDYRDIVSNEKDRATIRKEKAYRRKKSKGTSTGRLIGKVTHKRK